MSPLDVGLSVLKEARTQDVMLLRCFEELPSTCGGGDQPKMSWLIHIHLN